MENELFKDFYDKRFYISETPPYYAGEKSITRPLEQVIRSQEELFSYVMCDSIQPEAFGRLFYNASILLKGWIDNTKDSPPQETRSLDTKIELVKNLDLLSRKELVRAKKHFNDITYSRITPLKSLQVYEQFDHKSWGCTDPELIKILAKQIHAHMENFDDLLILPLGHGATRPGFILNHYLNEMDINSIIYPVRFSTHKMKDTDVVFINDMERAYIAELSRGRQVLSFNEDVQTGKSSRYFTGYFKNLLGKNVTSTTIVQETRSDYISDFYAISEDDFLHIMADEEERIKQGQNLSITQKLAEDNQEN